MSRHISAFLRGFLLCLGLLKKTSGQGAGPLGSISDYYERAFGNPFLGYWKNPGNKNPYGSQQLPYGAYGSYGASNLYGGSGYGIPGGYAPAGNVPPNYSGPNDRPGPAVPSILYNRYPASYDIGAPYGGYYGGAGGYYGNGYGMDTYRPFYGGAGNGFGGYGPGIAPGYGYGVGGYPGVAVDARNPADRALQDLLPSTYANKPWYP